MTLVLPLALGLLPPWRALPLVVAGLVAPVLGPRAAGVAMFVAVAPVWAAPVQSPWWPLQVLLLSVGALWHLWRAPRRVPGVWALAGLLVLLGAVLGLRQALLDVPDARGRGLALGLLGLSLGLGVMAWPGRRRGGPVLFVAGLGLAVEGQLWLASLARTPIREAAEQLSQRGAAAGWRTLARRSLVELDEGAPGALDSALAVVAARPWEVWPGRRVAEDFGALTAVRAGWQPMEELPPELAVETAMALDDIGERGRAIWLLRRHPRRGVVAFALSMLAAEDGDGALAHQAWERASVPEGARLAPGELVEALGLTTDGEHTVWMAAPTGIEQIVVEARGESYRGDPELEVVLSGHLLERVRVPERGGHWTWPVGLPPGAYRLRLRFDNDANGPEGDRNVFDIQVRAR